MSNPSVSAQSEKFRGEQELQSLCTPLAAARHYSNILLKSIGTRLLAFRDVRTSKNLIWIATP